MKVKENIPPRTEKTVDLLGLTVSEVALIQRFARYYIDAYAAATCGRDAAERLVTKLSQYENQEVYPYTDCFID